jgi:hypothetical protein
MQPYHTPFKEIEMAGAGKGASKPCKPGSKPNKPKGK